MLKTHDAANQAVVMRMRVVTQQLTEAVIILVLLAAGAWTASAAEPTADQIEFFENKVRPIFAERCYECHSASTRKPKGGLRLDSPAAVLKGGVSGPVVVAGDLEASRLITAIRYEDPDLQMPPDNAQLSKEEVALLESWVKMGAPLPRPSASQVGSASLEHMHSKHWAFQPVKKPLVPAVKNSRWIQTPVDNFVLAELQKHQLKPAPPADRRTLIRRLTYDLIGLPPTCEEVDAYLADKKPGATDRVVERLLASPHYGERWGRYWLDVARYADTKGYLAGGEERRYPFSYTYRDYVVRALNEDKPYNQFVTEQIAADFFMRTNASVKTDASTEARRDLAALGFLTLGRRFLNNENDIIDDRIDVVARGTLGLTVGCARCHDHKFDPISSKDYYALHGVFASSEEPAERPLLGPFHDSQEYQDFLKQRARIEEEIEAFKAKEVSKFIHELRQHVGDYLQGAHDAPTLEDNTKFELFAGERKLNPVVLKRWIKELDRRRKQADPIFSPWFELAALPQAGYATNATPLIATFASDPAKVNASVVQALSKVVSNSPAATVGVINALFEKIDSEWTDLVTAAGKENNPAPTALKEADREALRQVIYGENMPVCLPKAEAESILARPIGDGTAPIRNKIEALNWTHPGAPPRAMALEDRPHPGNSHVLLRGNPGSPGEEVPRRFLEILGGATSPAFTNGSGRLELARAITNPDNPLTARVYVNRIWLHHFGEGLVATPGDFGVRTPEPAEHALLDFLAASLVESGWSTKALHRLIVRSATYQQSCDATAESLKADPENKLLSRMNRQRLDWEAARDTLLAIAGRLDPKVGGLPVELENEPFTTRRTIYGLIDRQNLPGVFRSFDFANPDTSSQRRFQTTVPQQALYLMNSPFVLEQARSLAQRPEVKQAANSAAKIQALYRLALQRPAVGDEVRLGEQFLAAQSQGNAKVTPLEKYAQVLLLSNEMMFVE
jgi:hypothetical protein